MIFRRYISAIKETEMQQKIKELTEKLKYYSRKYYVDDEPEISDYEYDMLLRELSALEKEYPQFKLPDSPRKESAAKR